MLWWRSLTWPWLPPPRPPHSVCLITWGSPGHCLPDPDPEHPSPPGERGPCTLCSGPRRLLGPAVVPSAPAPLSPPVPVNLVAVTAVQSCCTRHSRCPSSHPASPLSPSLPVWVVSSPVTLQTRPLLRPCPQSLPGCFRVPSPLQSSGHLLTYHTLVCRLTPLSPSSVGAFHAGREVSIFSGPR